MVDQRNLRVSDAEREHVGALLQRAVGQGMISVAEFGERMDAAMASRTRAELNSVVADLPGLQIGGRAPLEPDMVRGVATSLVRRGPWTVPPRLRVEARFSSTMLDFTQAQVKTPVVEIWFDSVCGSATLLLPKNATADTDRVEATMGSVHNKVRIAPQSKTLHCVVYGTMRVGSLTVKHPFGGRWRQLRR